MSKTTVIYHKSDFDGIFCREIARKFLPPDTEFIGWEYGEPTPVVPFEHTLYILDLSVHLLMSHPKLIWIDHHATAIDQYPHAIPGYRLDGVAACRLAWQWFAALAVAKSKEGSGMGVQTVELPTKHLFVNRALSEPLAVRLAGEYDIWDKRDPDADLFQHGLRSEDVAYDALLANNGADYVKYLLNQGRAIAYAKTQENERIIQNNGFTVPWEGLTFLCCNAGSYNSYLFTAGIRPEHDGLLGFSLRANGKWSISLYGVPGKPDVNLAAIATKYGGGGHKQACGFTCATLPFLP